MRTNCRFGRVPATSLSFSNKLNYIRRALGCSKVFTFYLNNQNVPRFCGWYPATNIVYTLQLLRARARVWRRCFWLACWWNPRTAILAWVPQAHTNQVLQKVSHLLIRNKRACPQATFFFSRILHLGSTRNLQYDKVQKHDTCESHGWHKGSNVFKLPRACFQVNNLARWKTNCAWFRRKTYELKGSAHL